MTTPQSSRISPARRRLMAASILAPLVLSSALAFAQTPAAAPSAPPAEAVTVNQLRDMSAIRLEGRVVEIFGERFVLEDATGRTLVITGPQAREGLVKVGDTVSVEGRYGRGEMRASALTPAGGERIALRGPDGPGHEGPGHDGPGHDGARGPGGGHAGSDGEHGPGAERGPGGEHGPGRDHGPQSGGEHGAGPQDERAEGHDD